jgi:hypothetical protein
MEVSTIEKSAAVPKRFKFAKGIAWLFLMLSLYILFYTYWRSEVANSGSFRLNYIFFYLIGFSGSLFWVVVLRLQDEIRLNLVLVSTSLVVGVYLMEVCLSFVLPLPSAAHFAAKKAGIFYDSRTKIEFVMDLKKEGVDAVPYSMYSPHFTLDGGKLFSPLGWISKKTTVVENETGKYMVIMSDRYGFNNPDSVWDTEKVDWVLIGDSFTYGVAVQSGEDIGSQIRSMTNDSVINLGRAGTGPLFQLVGLKEYAEAKAPKRVIWIYWEGNDLSELANEPKLGVLMKYLQTGYSQGLIDRQEEIDAILTEGLSGLYKTASFVAEPQEEVEGQSMLSRFFHRLKVEAVENSKGLRIRKEEPWMILRLSHLRTQIGFHPSELIFNNKNQVSVTPLFAEILTKAKERVTAQGGKLYFVYLPRAERYIRYFTNHDTFSQRGEVLSIVKSLGIPVIDIHQEVFDKHPDPLELFPLRMRAHFNAKGYRLTSEAIVKEIKRMEGTH